ncbi:membrane dipeptidase [Pelagicoccus sp. SDUM812003]|uniref:membrane dipeptidase n=1 Tax=Pelagicoccus sp. SDUM812003 TaxID=3041267 RepID=UPI00280F7F67|nr:membrane dipeptidase [Pelagicoccus sp. SDUM812003]MDQ8204075.1 membrane dipeptidase [Pelagicoccus sp. SDUM812003]
MHPLLRYTFTVFAATSIATATFADKSERTPRDDWSEAQLLELAKEVHDSCLTIDTHMDVPIVLKRPGFDISDEHSWHDHASQVDFPRMEAGGMDGGFFVIYVGQGELTHEGRANAIASGFEIARLIHDTVEQHSALAAIATSSEEAYAIREEGKRVVFIGIENGYTIGRNIDLLRDYHQLGARYFGITHSRNNDLADSSTDPDGNLHMGLSDLGRAAVEECNRLGIMVDISHASDKTAWDILELSETPIIASHSACYACWPHPRNLNDALLKEIAARDGVVQMNMFSAYMMEVPENEQRSEAMKAWFEKYRSGKELTEEEQVASVEEYVAIQQEFPKPLSTVSAVVDHIDHMVEVMGIEHVGISGDFDGGGGVEGSMDIGQMMPITVEMLRRGYTEDELELFWGANVMRVLDACQDYAEALAAEEAKQET